jgi:hypothetical protein
VADRDSYAAEQAAAHLERAGRSQQALPALKVGH